MDDISQFQDLFLETSSDHIDKLTSLLTKYKESSDVTLIDGIHLHLHSLKGEVLAMKYSQLGEYITVLELFVKSLKVSNSILSDDKIQIIYDSLSVVVQAIQHIKDEKKEPSGLEAKSAILKQQLGITL